MVSAVLLLCGASASAGEGAGNETDREIIAVRSDLALEMGDPVLAEALLREHLKIDADDPNARARLSRILFNQSQGAEGLLQMELAFASIDSRKWSTPERVMWSSLRAQLLCDLKRRDEASQSLKSLEAFPEYRQWLGEAQHHLAEVRGCVDGWPAPGPIQRRWFFQAQAAAGQDTNYAFISDPTANSLSSSELGSLYSDIAVQANRIDQDSVRAHSWRIATTYRQYVTAEARYYNSLTPSVAWGRQEVPADPYVRNLWSHSVQAQGNFINLDGLQLYLYSLDARSGVRRSLGRVWSQSLQGVLQYTGYGSGYAGDDTEDRSGLSAGFATSIDRRSGQFQFSLGLMGLRLQAAGTSYQGYAVTAPLLLNWSTRKGVWSVEFASQPSERIYSGATTARKDLWLDARLSLHRGLSSKWRLGIDGNWQKNNSNLEDYDFQKIEAALFVRYQP